MSLINVIGAEPSVLYSGVYIPYSRGLNLQASFIRVSFIQRVFIRITVYKNLSGVEVDGEVRGQSDVDHLEG